MHQRNKCKAKGRKAQAAIEFTILIGFIAFIFVLLLSVFSDVIYNSNKDSLSKERQNYLDYVEGEITLAKNSMEGYARSFALPASVNNGNYTFVYSNDSMTLYTNEGETTKLLPPYTNGSFCVKPDEAIYRSLVIQRRANSEVFLENCPDCMQEAYYCEEVETAGSCLTSITSTQKAECCNAYCFCCS